MKFNLIRKLGSGAYGTVYEAYDIDNNKFAVKIIVIDQFTGIPFLIEPSIMSIYDHPYINSAVKVYSDLKQLCIVQELATTDLRRYVYNNGSPSIDTLRLWFFEITQAVRCLHNNNIIHADIKGSNVLLCKNGNVKLTDFTLSSMADWPHRYMACTATHRAPEVWLKREWNKPIDIWSLGCTFYELAYGLELFPYQGGSGTTSDSESDGNLNTFLDWIELGLIPNQKLNVSRRQVQYKPLNIDKTFDVNTPLNDLILKMLHVIPQHRITIEDALAHPFFQDMTITPYRLLPVPEAKLNGPQIKLFGKLSREYDDLVKKYAYHLYAKIVNMGQLCDKAKIETCLWIYYKQIYNKLPDIPYNLTQMVLNEKVICNYLAFKLLPITN